MSGGGDMEAKIELAMLNAQEATQAQLNGCVESVKACISCAQRHPVRFTLACVGTSMALLMILGNGTAGHHVEPSFAPTDVASALRGGGAMRVLTGPRGGPTPNPVAAGEEEAEPQDVVEEIIENARAQQMQEAKENGEDPAAPLTWEDEDGFPEDDDDVILEAAGEGAFDDDGSEPEDSTEKEKALADNVEKFEKLMKEGEEDEKLAEGEGEEADPLLAAEKDFKEKLNEQEAGKQDLPEEAGNQEEPTSVDGTGAPPADVPEPEGDKDKDAVAAPTAMPNQEDPAAGQVVKEAPATTTEPKAEEVGSVAKEAPAPAIVNQTGGMGDELKDTAATSAPATSAPASSAPATSAPAIAEDVDKVVKEEVPATSIPPTVVANKTDDVGEVVKEQVPTQAVKAEVAAEVAQVDSPVPGSTGTASPAIDTKVGEPVKEVAPSSTPMPASPAIPESPSTAAPSAPADPAVASTEATASPAASSTPAQNQTSAKPLAEVQVGQVLAANAPSTSTANKTGEVGEVLKETPTTKPPDAVVNSTQQQSAVETKGAVEVESTASPSTASPSTARSTNASTSLAGRASPNSTSSLPSAPAGEVRAETAAPQLEPSTQPPTPNKTPNNTALPAVVLTTASPSSSADVSSSRSIQNLTASNSTTAASSAAKVPAERDLGL